MMVVGTESLANMKTSAVAAYRELVALLAEGGECPGASELAAVLVPVGRSLAQLESDVATYQERARLAEIVAAGVSAGADIDRLSEERGAAQSDWRKIEIQFLENQAAARMRMGEIDSRMWAALDVRSAAARAGAELRKTTAPGLDNEPANFVL
jgi:hypothetical protein